MTNQIRSGRYNEQHQDDAGQPSRHGKGGKVISLCASGEFFLRRVAGCAMGGGQSAPIAGGNAKVKAFNGNERRVQYLFSNLDDRKSSLMRSARVLTLQIGTNMEKKQKNSRINSRIK